MQKRSRHLKQKNKTKTPLVLFGSLVALLSIALSFLLFYSPTEKSNIILPEAKQNDSTQKEETTTQNPGDISIPGYECLYFAADTLQQSISLENPAQNNCYFVLSLYLSDNTLLWQSEYINPGQFSSPILLKQALAAGSYPDAHLIYSCYSLDKDKTPLNGADIELTIFVK